MSFEELDKSELGTQEYWDKTYKAEVSNFRAHGDVGEVWFGGDISERVVEWLLKKSIPKSHSIIDIGCGNGMLLVELAANGFENLTGVDYSADAVVLAKEVAEQRNARISYHVRDVLKDAMEVYDVALDKGTYDAVSLSGAKGNREGYIKKVHELLKSDGLLVITSCNWTQGELEGQFKRFFSLYDVVPTPQFKFGGKVGSVVSSVVFRRL